jgi:hypothetical protein
MTGRCWTDTHARCRVAQVKGLSQRFEEAKLGDVESVDVHQSIRGIVPAASMF